jgi:hypothetical protein
MEMLRTTALLPSVEFESEISTAVLPGSEGAHRLLQWGATRDNWYNIAIALTDVVVSATLSLGRLLERLRDWAQTVRLEASKRQRSSMAALLAVTMGWEM